MCNALTVVFFIGKRIYFHNSSSSNIILQNDSLLTYTINKVIWNQAKTNLFKIQKHDSSDIVFLGNSLTEGFPLQEMFQSLKVKNRGIGGNTTNDILLRLNEVTDGKPKKIFLEIGINDIGKGISIDTIFNNLKKIAELIKTNSPSTKLYIQSAFPTALSSKVLIPKIEQYNQKIKDYCTINRITFINLYPSFYKDNGLDTSLTTDGIHFNEKGYSLWKQQIDKYVND